MALRTALANPAIPDSDTLSPRGADQWNQIIYKKIAVMGDSGMAQWRMFEDTWPSLLERRLNAAGAKVEVKNFAVGSHTFHRAITNTDYDPLTMVQAVIAYKPDVVIVELGGNDAIAAALGTGDGRTLTQAQQDATDVYTALKAGLPSALFIQIRWALHDSDNFTSSNVKNKGMLVRLITPKSSGILNGLNTSEYLDDTVSADNRGVLDDYADILTTIDGISGVEIIDANLWRVERLGALMIDRQHLNETGQRLLCGYVMKGLEANTAFRNVVPIMATQLTGSLFEGEDPDEFFNDILDASGDGYTAAAVDYLGAEDVVSQWATRGIHLDKWYMTYKGSCVLDRSTSYQGNGFEGFLGFYIDGCVPNTLVTYSVDGAAFATTGYTTDADGRIRGTIAPHVLNLSVASHDFRFKVGNDVYGPFSVAVATNIFFITNHTSVGNVGGGTDDLMTNTLTAGWFLPTAGRRVAVKQHGTTANNANGKTISSLFGSQTIFSFVATPNLAGNWRFEYEVVATGDDTQKFSGTVWAQTGAGTALAFPYSGTATQDDDAAIVIKCTGAAVSNDDIVQTYQEIDPR